MGFGLGDYKNLVFDYRSRQTIVQNNLYLHDTSARKKCKCIAEKYSTYPRFTKSTNTRVFAPCMKKSRF
jgi:hypothetical protein